MQKYSGGGRWAAIHNPGVCAGLTTRLRRIVADALDRLYWYRHLQKWYQVLRGLEGRQTTRPRHGHVAQWQNVRRGVERRREKRPGDRDFTRWCEVCWGVQERQG